MILLLEEDSEVVDGRRSLLSAGAFEFAGTVGD